MRDAEKRCKTCQWWEAGRDYPQKGWGGCRLSETESGASRQEGMHVSTADGYYGILLTAPDFGCVQWEAT